MHLVPVLRVGDRLHISDRVVAVAQVQQAAGLEAPQPRAGEFGAVMVTFAPGEFSLLESFDRVECGSC